MNESYRIENLILGKIFICTQTGGLPISTTYSQTHIFYRKENTAKNVLKNNKKILEVFTDDEFEIYEKDELTHDHKFNKPYVVNVESIIPYLTKEELTKGIILKWRLIEIYNQINFEKQNNNQKQLQK